MITGKDIAIRTAATLTEKIITIRMTTIRQKA